MSYEKLKERGKIGSLDIRNRVVLPAMGTSLAASTGEASEEIITYYQERAKGGAGLIITEITRVDDEHGIGLANQLAVTDGKHIPRLEKLVRALHCYDTRVFVQLHHPGRQGHSQLIGGRQIVAPSPVMCNITREEPRELDTGEVEKLVKKFVKGAAIARAAGVDGIELHGAHGYLINQFLSPYTNQREDKYGGDFQGRMRFLGEIISGIKHTCGNEFPISVRISADEFNPAGIDLNEGINIAAYLENTGVDVLNVSCGTYETGTTIIEPSSFKEAWKKHLASAVKKAVNIPVIAVNNIKEPQTAENLLQEGVCDYVGVGRSQLADPAWFNKAVHHRENDIRPCISCLHCISELTMGRNFKCTVNPRLGREKDFNLEPPQKGNSKTIAVVGGGPAGMAAAETLALRGHKPVLFEKEKEPGGLLKTAARAPRKERLEKLKDYLVKRLTDLNVDIHLESKADVDTVKELSPHTVLVAGGAEPVIPGVPGVNKNHVHTAEQALNMEIKNKTVAVIGSGLSGLETARYLARRENKVLVVEMLKDIGPGITPMVKADISLRLGKYDVEYLTLHELKEIEDSQVILLNRETSKTVSRAAEVVVLCLGLTPKKELAEAFQEEFSHCYLLGDINRPARIGEAIRDGLEKGSII